MNEQITENEQNTENDQGIEPVQTEENVQPAEEQKQAVKPEPAISEGRISAILRVLMILSAVIVIIVGTLAFVYFSGIGDNVFDSIRKNGFNARAIWDGMTSKEPETEAEPEETDASIVLDQSDEQGGAVYVRDGVTYIRADIDVKDDAVTDSEDPAYRVLVNLACQCVTVYKIFGEGRETPVRVFPCSTARDGHETPEGRYPLQETYDWCFLEDGSYAQYAMRIGGDIGDGYMFHTVPYSSDTKSSLEWYEYNKLGSPASLGCIRIPAGEMYWLREHVSSGGEVLIYSDPDNPGDLGFPSTYYIPEEVTQARGWDPTDPDSKNPWHSYDLTLTVPEEITVSASKDGLDITEYASAEDVYGNDLSGYIKYQKDNDRYGFTYTVNNYNDPDDYTDEKGNIEYDKIIEISHSYMDISKPGEYEIRVFISIGPVTASRTIKLTVTD